MLGALHAQLGQALCRPVLALALHCRSQVLFIVGVAPFVTQPLGPLLAKHRQVRAVFSTLARLLNQALAVGNLGMDIKVARPQRRARRI